MGRPRDRSGTQRAATRVQNEFSNSPFARKTMNEIESAEAELMRRAPRSESDPPAVSVRRMSVPVQVFGCRHAETIPTPGQPASEKRQGTKSRGVGTDSAAGAMGIWRRGECWGSWADAGDRIVLARILGVGTGANERIARCSTGFAVRSRASLADRRKRGVLPGESRPKPLAAVNVAPLCARTELARVHVLDHALAQRADGIRTHR
jgi:hypothetical protein